MSLLEALQSLCVTSNQPYEERSLGKDEVNGVRVSTIWAADEQKYETAICDEISCYPVERYTTREEAEAGHKKWLKKAKTIKKVTMLGWESAGDFSEEEIVLVREK